LLPSGARAMTKTSQLSVFAVLALAAVVLSAQRAHPSADAPAKPTQAFKVTGNVIPPLRPGLTLPVNVKVRNLHRVAISISRLRAEVLVDAAHRSAGCSPKRDFVVTQLPARAYPLKLGPLRAKPLAALGRRVRPRVTMRNLPDVDQGACKGAKLTLRYSGRAFPQKLVAAHGRRPAGSRP